MNCELVREKELFFGGLAEGNKLECFLIKIQIKDFNLQKNQPKDFYEHIKKCISKSHPLETNSQKAQIETLEVKETPVKEKTSEGTENLGKEKLSAVTETTELTVSSAENLGNAQSSVGTETTQLTETSTENLGNEKSSVVTKTTELTETSAENLGNEKSSVVAKTTELTESSAENADKAKSSVVTETTEQTECSAEKLPSLETSILKTDKMDRNEDSDATEVSAKTSTS